MDRLDAMQLFVRVAELGSFAGAMSQSPADSSPDEGPLPGDLETARLFGIRIAEQAIRLG